MIQAEKVIGKDGRYWIKVIAEPYHEEIARALFSVKGAKYDASRNLWAIPYEYLDDFNSKMEDYLVIWDNEESIWDKGGISENDLPDTPVVPYEFKTKPYDFQIKGFNALVERDFLILADDAGLGKTFQLATAMAARKQLGQVKHGLVLTKASLIYNWRDEIHKHTNDRAIVIDGPQKQRFKLYSDLKLYDDDWTFLIMSYELFRDDIANIRLLNSFCPLDFCILDEAHKVKNPTSKLGSYIHLIPFKYRYAVTATPLPNSPLEAFNYLKWGGVINMNWWQFQHRYAIFGGYNKKEVIHFRRMKELKKLIQDNMLRRRKKDKLKNLPELKFMNVYVEMTPAQRRIYTGIKENILEDLKDTTLERIPSILAKMLRLQQVTDSLSLVGAEFEKEDSAKLNMLDTMLNQIISSGDKVIVFSRFREMVDLLKERYKMYNPAVVHGDISSSGRSEKTVIRELKSAYGEEWFNNLSPEEKKRILDYETASDRQKEVYKFQGDDSCKLFIGCTPACREGLTLTAANHVIFLDCEWSPAYVEQAYSRAHRIGQNRPVHVYYLICTNTIDEYVQETLRRKETMAQILLDEGVNKNVSVSRAKEVLASMIGA